MVSYNNSQILGNDNSKDLINDNFLGNDNSQDLVNDIFDKEKNIISSNVKSKASDYIINKSKYAKTLYKFNNQIRPKYENMMNPISHDSISSLLNSIKDEFDKDLNIDCNIQIIQR
jgi:hypothetical protein